MAKKPVSIEHVTASIARWKTRLRRAVNMIDKLEKQLKRMEKRVDLAVAPPLAKKPAVRVSLPAHPTVDSETTLGAVPPDLSIPSFLRRDKPDPVAEQIKAEQAEIKKKKAAGRIAKMKAKKSGELSKMPLTGRAALDAIRNG